MFDVGYNSILPRTAETATPRPLQHRRHIFGAIIESVVTFDFRFRANHLNQRRAACCMSTSFAKHVLAHLRALS